MMRLLILILGRWLLLVEILSFVLLFILTPRRHQKRFLYLILLSGLLALALASKAGLFYNSPRPYDIDHITPLLISSHVHDNGFPSSHGLLAFTLAWLALSRSKRWGLVFILMAVGVAEGRILGHVHHLIDIIGSAFIAGLAVLIVYYSLNVKAKRNVYKLVRGSDTN